VSPGKTPLADGARMDLIFGDIVMPGTIDGVGLATEVRTLHPDLQVVLRSATAMRADSASGFANSGDAGSRSHPRDCQATSCWAIAAEHSGDKRC